LISGEDGVILISLFGRLKELSRLTPEYLMSRPYDKSLRCHQIIWEETDEDCFGFPMEEEIVEIPYQFQISKQRGRVHGFFLDCVFYIVWIDKNHNLYP